MSGEGILDHANHFKTTRFSSTDLVQEYFPDSYIRYHRLIQLVNNYRGNLSLDLMKLFLQDHNNHPNSICRHPDAENPLPIGRMIKTLVNLISCPKERKAHIALGNPYRNEYLEYFL